MLAFFTAFRSSLSLHPIPSKRTKQNFPPAGASLIVLFRELGVDWDPILLQFVSDELDSQLSAAFLAVPCHCSLLTA